MKKVLAALAGSALVAILAVPAAQAASSSGQAFLKVTIPTAISFEFVSPQTLDFGTVLPGGFATGTMTYKVTTNSGSGFHLDITDVVRNGDPDVQFSIRKDDLGTYAPLPNTGNSVLNWRGPNIAGGTFTDGFKVDVGANAKGQVEQYTFTYLATTD